MKLSFCFNPLLIGARETFLSHRHDRGCGGDYKFINPLIFWFLLSRITFDNTRYISLIITFFSFDVKEKIKSEILSCLLLMSHFHNDI